MGDIMDLLRGDPVAFLKGVTVGIVLMGLVLGFVSLSF